MESSGILQFADRILCPKNRVLYLSTAYYLGYEINSYTSLNINEYLYLKVADLVIYLA